MSKKITEKTFYYVDGNKFSNIEEAETYADMEFPDEAVIDGLWVICWGTTGLIAATT